ncbi:MAG: DNA polymerase III subunit epsilon [Candidatus Binataceae bacterium]
MREIVVDTETTGLDPADHRIVEIGCVELFNHIATGKEFHAYLNPERDMPAEAEAVHGLTAAFLADKPLFASVVDDLIAFVGDAPLVAHNAGFDLGFINAEFRRVGRSTISSDRTIDTVGLARRKYPGAPASLDALCRRFAVDTSSRTKHGALLDAQLLSKVYLELVGGREPGLALAVADNIVAATSVQERVMRVPRAHAASPHELAAHAGFIATLKNAIWLKLAPKAEPAQDANAA